MRQDKYLFVVFINIDLFCLVLSMKWLTSAVCFFSRVIYTWVFLFFVSYIFFGISSHHFPRLPNIKLIYLLYVASNLLQLDIFNFTTIRQFITHKYLPKSIGNHTLSNAARSSLFSPRIFAKLWAWSVVSCGRPGPGTKTGPVLPNPAQKFAWLVGPEIFGWAEMFRDGPGGPGRQLEIGPRPCHPGFALTDYHRSRQQTFLHEGHDTGHMLYAHVDGRRPTAVKQKEAIFKKNQHTPPNVAWARQFLGKKI